MKFLALGSFIFNWGLNMTIIFTYLKFSNNRLSDSLTFTATETLRESLRKDKNR